ncbi:hypothetical protein SCOR_10670 [Sulfidibacter corallicola]
MERCPLCRAAHRGGAQCHRCGADLTLLLTIEDQAEQWRVRAMADLANGDPNAARTAIERACKLKRTPYDSILQAFLSSDRG